MPLPENNSQWPLPGHGKALSHMAEWSAWYSGDPAQLRSYYETHRSTGLPRTREAQLHGGVVGTLARWWWGAPATNGEASAKLHVPLAGDICGTSADLLFSEQIKLTTDNDALAQALHELQEGGLDANLHEAAEVTAGLGGGYLRVVWDEAVSKLPWTDTVHADMALPTFRWGRLAEVTFWQLLPSHGDRTVWRLLEHHEPGRINHALYRGTVDNLGLQQPLEAHPAAAPLALIVDDLGGIATGTQLLTATYVPNMRPNRMDRGSKQGRSDLQGVTGFLDALDEAYSSWWRDIRLAKSRVFMPSQYLESNGPGQGASASLDRELFVPVNTLARDLTGLGIQVEQFNIRVAEHKDTCEAWTKTIIESAGYSTQSLSSDSGGAVTAAEVHSHERRSYMTRGKKVRYWKQAISEHLQALVAVANANLSAAITPGLIAVEFPDAVQEDQLSVAQTALALSQAEAASIETRVKMVNPEWDQATVDLEVSRIQSETNAGGGIFDPTGL